MEPLKGYDNWKTTEPYSDWDGCEDCGEDCRAYYCLSCNNPTKGFATCTEENFCSMACAQAADL